MDSIRRTLVLVLILFGSCLVFTSSAVRADRASCEQIRTACKEAGFILGSGARNGLVLDCYDPIVQGTPQPKVASRPLAGDKPEIGGRMSGRKRLSPHIVARQRTVGACLRAARRSTIPI